jgi:hypothetical protein
MRANLNEKAEKESLVFNFYQPFFTLTNAPPNSFGVKGDIIHFYQPNYAKLSKHTVKFG